RIGLAPERVLRVWEFTTRSPDDPRRALRHVREASVAAVQSATVTFDEVEIPTDRPHVALIVHGHLHGIPTFLTPEERNFVLDDEGLPIPQGTTDVPFRVLVPAGAGDYRFVMYGHGTGGHERDAAFDDRLAEI